MYIQTGAIVLKETFVKDHDKFLTLFTREEGVLSAYGRGVRRQGHPLLAVCQLMAYSQVSLFVHRGRVTLDDGELEDAFFGLRRNWEALDAAVSAGELAARLCAQEVPHPEVFSLLLNTYHVLSLGKYNTDIVRAAFQLRCMSLCGFHPHLDGCGACGLPEPAAFHPLQGMTLCRSCADGNLPILGEGVYLAMRHILTADNPFAFTLTPPEIKRLAAVCQMFIHAQVEA